MLLGEILEKFFVFFASYKYIRYFAGWNLQSRHFHVDRTHCRTVATWELKWAERTLKFLKKNWFFFNFPIFYIYTFFPGSELTMKCLSSPWKCSLAAVLAHWKVWTLTTARKKMFLQNLPVAPIFFTKNWYSFENVKFQHLHKVL